MDNYYEKKKSIYLCNYMFKKMDPKIKKTLNAIPKNYREDVEQEIRVKMFEIINNFLRMDNPGYFEFQEMIEGEKNEKK